MSLLDFIQGAPLVAALLLGSAAAQETDADETARLTRGWEALRAMDCARCHGRDYTGWVSSSLVAAAREYSRERFESIVLDGIPERGMPGYRSQPVVVSQIDAIREYLLARAEKSLPPGRPQLAAGPPPLKN